MTSHIIGTNPPANHEIRVIVPKPLQEPLSRWLAARGMYLYVIQDGPSTFGIATVTTPEEVTATPGAPHYEAGAGIRPPHKGGRVRGVAYEIVPGGGGGVELWHCDHDHAPGVKDMRKILPHQRDAAEQCAAAWLDGEIASGGLARMPVTRAES